MSEYPHIEDDDEFLDALGELLRTQDNRITANPLWTLQVKTKRYGIDPDHTCPDGWRLIDDDGEAVDESVVAPDAGVEGRGTWYPFVYEWVPAPGVVSLTEVGLQAHLDINRHNYRGDIHTYVESMWRCEEMQRLREILMRRGVER